MHSNIQLGTIQHIILMIPIPGLVKPCIFKRIHVYGKIQHVSQEYARLHCKLSTRKFGDFNTRAKVSYLFEKVKLMKAMVLQVRTSALGGVPTMDAISGNISSTSYQDAIIAKNYFGILYFDYKDKYIFDGMIPL